MQNKSTMAIIGNQFLVCLSSQQQMAFSERIRNMIPNDISANFLWPEVVGGPTLILTEYSERRKECWTGKYR